MTTKMPKTNTLGSSMRTLKKSRIYAQRSMRLKLRRNSTSSTSSELLRVPSHAKTGFTNRKSLTFKARLTD